MKTGPQLRNVPFLLTPNLLYLSNRQEEKPLRRLLLFIGGLLSVIGSFHVITHGFLLALSLCKKSL